MLVEVRLYKNEFHIEHEFLLAKFKSPSYTIYVATERRSKHPSSDHKVTREECEQQLLLAQEPKALDPGSLMVSLYGADALRFVNLAEDYFQLFENVDTFDSALEQFMETKEGHFHRQAFFERASVNYPDPEIVAASAPSPSYSLSEATHPNLLDFTSAVVATSKTQLFYSAFEHNCFWFASATIFILNFYFEDSHRVNIDKGQGTVKVPLAATLTFGELKEGDYEALIIEYKNRVSAILFCAQVLVF